MNTPARTSVTPARSRAKVAVGVEPMLTTGHGQPCARRTAALPTTASRSRLAKASSACGSSRA